MVLVVKRNDNGMATEKLYGCRTIFEQEEHVRKLVNPSGTSLYFMLNKRKDDDPDILSIKMPFRDEKFIKNIIRTLNEFEDIDRIEIECKYNDNIDILIWAGLAPHNIRHIYQTVGTIELW